MEKHVSAIHEECRPFKCEICETKFTSIYKLKADLSSIHGGEKTFKCLRFDSEFAHKNHRQRYAVVSDKGKPKALGVIILTQIKQREINIRSLLVKKMSLKSAKFAIYVLLLNSRWKFT